MPEQKPYAFPEHSLDIQRIRAMKMLEMRIAGLKLSEIATQMNCHVDTVSRWLAWAERQGLTKKYENELVSLGQLAIKVYKDKLSSDDPDPYIAKDVIDKLIKLGDRFEQREGQKEELGLKAYLTGLKIEGKIDGSKQTAGQTEPTGPTSITVERVENKTDQTINPSNVRLLNGKGVEDAGADSASIEERTQGDGEDFDSVGLSAADGD